MLIPNCSVCIVAFLSRLLARLGIPFWESVNDYTEEPFFQAFYDFVFRWIRVVGAIRVLVLAFDLHLILQTGIGIIVLGGGRAVAVGGGGRGGRVGGNLCGTDGIRQISGRTHFIGFTLSYWTKIRVCLFASY
jgi:hypothetical protein